MIPRFTDSGAFRLPYVRVEDQPPYGYLVARFEQYRELQRAEAAASQAAPVESDSTFQAHQQSSSHPHEVLPLKRRR